MKKTLLKAILWSVACVLVIAAALVNEWASEKMGIVMILLAIVCAGLQWVAFFKNGR